MKYVMGLDFGTDSASALIVNAETGETVATSKMEYPRWSKGLYCNSRKNQWRQHPRDYIETMEKIVHDAIDMVDQDVTDNIIGLAFDTTGSTPSIIDETGTPLAMMPEFTDNPNAMFILWKDHTAVAEAEEINKVCATWPIDYTKYCGGVYSAEWYWAKVIHVIREDDAVAAKAYSVIEVCEWLPALVTGVKHAKDIVRSRCACGHKALWHEEWGGLPNEEFFVKVEPKLAGIRNRLFTETLTADKPVGTLSREWAQRLGLPEGIIVAGGAYDCHMGAVGAGVTPNTLVRVIGASTCDVMVADYESIGKKCIKGICGQVDGSVIPGMIGLEAGQSCFEDVFKMFKNIMAFSLTSVMADVLKQTLSSVEADRLIKAACDNILDKLYDEAGQLPLSDSRMIALDWINGRRSPDANQMVKGVISGLTLGTSAPQIFKALIDATAYGSRAIVERFEAEGIHINEIIALGDTALRSSFIIQTMCDVTNKPIKICNTDNACALGAAMFAATAAGVYEKVEDAIAVMNSGFMKEYYPIQQNVEAYEIHYKNYLALGKFTEDAKL